MTPCYSQGCEASRSATRLCGNTCNRKWGDPASLCMASAPHFAIGPRSANFPREIAEAALAHVLKDKTEAAYQRGDMLERRRMLMSAWAEFCTSGAAARKVLPLRKLRKRNTTA
jgi:hypothetical protein